MKSRTWIIIAGAFLALVIVAGACSAGFLVGWAYAPTAKANAEALPAYSDDSSSSQDSGGELFKPFWEAWQIAHDYYLEQPVDDEAMMQGAIRGMLDALDDPQTSYMDPFEYKDSTASISGEYEGIGAWVNIEGEYLLISEPMPGSPAEKAGLLPGDEIIAIDGEDMTGVLPMLARRKVLGPAGSTVILTIRREGVEEPFDVSVTRASIQVSSVDGRMLDGDIGYVKVRNFGEQTTSELRTALDDLLREDPIGLVLDLRNNPGGSLTTAIELASEFVGDGVILYTEYGDGSRETYEAIKGGLATEIPLVVLVNQFSASASEVVAGAIQDTGRGTLVGVTTFGKGTVQQIIPLSDEQGAVRVTIAHWITPNERIIQDIGLTPDIEVDRTDEEIQAQEDPQLDKAIEILTQK